MVRKQIVALDIKDIEDDINSSDILRTSKDNNKNNIRIREYFAKKYPGMYIDFTNSKSTGVVTIKRVMSQSDAEEMRQKHMNVTNAQNKRIADCDRFYKRVKSPSAHNKLMQSIQKRLDKDGIDATVERSRSIVGTLSFYIKAIYEDRDAITIKVSDHNTIGQQMTYRDTYFINLKEVASVDELYSEIKRVFKS